jgi:hypothetical protein
MASLFLDEDTAVNNPTNYIASTEGGPDDNDEAELSFASTAFTYLGKEYTIGRHDDLLAYHMKASGSGPDKVYRIGPFYDLTTEEKPIYKNNLIARSRAEKLIDEKTHIDKSYSVVGVFFAPVFSYVRIVSSKVRPSQFTGRIEGVSIALTRNSIVTTAEVHKYERLSR